MDKPLLTVPTLLVAGVAALGVYAAYRLTKTDGGSSTDKEDTGGGKLPLLGDPLTLAKNRYYRARIETRPDNNVNAPPFLATMDASIMQNALEILGFRDVKLYMNEAALPSDWPSEARKGATPASRWFEGQWNLPTGQVPRPSDIALIWTSAPPTGAKFTVSGEPDRLLPPYLDWSKSTNTWGNAPPVFVDEAEFAGAVG